MKIALIVLLLVLIASTGFADRLKGSDWPEMSREEKKVYLYGYIDGRIIEVSNVFVLSMKFTVGGKMLYEDQIIRQFIDYIDEKGLVWDTLLIDEFVDAVDQAVVDNQDLLHMRLFQFVNEALTVYLRVE